ncbi:arginase family protein [Brucella pituitosa]|uniref:arginase family protein n=1 Tax=Brucella pituitosa TaxID=571256 RepID=UPI003C76C245
MKIDPTKILRLNFPQWQGGDRPDYKMGARVLSTIAPSALGPVETIAVADAGSHPRPIEQGIVSRQALLSNLTAAQSAIARHNPDAIVTLGGDCLINLAPTSYLSQRYGDDLAVLWVDAHPDIMTAEQFQNAHAHVLGMLMGIGDAEFVEAVPKPVKASNILYVGLTETTPYESEFISKHGIARLSPEDLIGSAEPVLNWLRNSGAKKVAVHFDLDVLDPDHYGFLLSQDPDAEPTVFEGVAEGRMRFEEVANILNAVDAEADIVGLAIAEYMPWNVIQLSRSLKTLPLLGAT